MPPLHESVIGFDLGHGETALARIELGGEGRPEPNMLELAGGRSTRKNIVSAIAHHPTKGIVIGEVAVNLRGTQNLLIGFKRRPSTADAQYQQTLQQYVEAVYQGVTASYPSTDWSGTHIYIGCPSGWDDDDKQQYEQILDTANQSKPTVVRESRAALMHARESNQINIAELQGALLVIDIGSSTTDFTLVESLVDQPIDFGAEVGDLGASLLDKAILARSIAHHENRDELRSLLERDQHSRNRCEFLSRRAKEEYFSNPDLYEDDDSPVAVGFEDFQHKGPVFTPLLNRPIMEELLSQPLEALHNKTWPQEFREQIEGVRDRLAEKNISLDTILLTGGASRMAFVRQIISEVFPDVMWKPDPEPEYSIARGLARWGRVDILTRRFRQEVDDLLKTELAEMVPQKVPTLISAIAQALSDALVVSVISPGISSWRNNRITTIKDLEAQLNSQATQWVAGATAKGIIAQEVNTWSRSIQEALQPKVNAIGTKYGLTPGVLPVRANIYFDAGTLPRLAIQDPTILTTLVAAIVGVVLAAIIIAVIVASSTIGGPIAWIVGFIGWAVAGEAITDAATEQIKKADLPDWVRPGVLSEEKERSVLAEKKPTLKQGIQDVLSKDTALTSNIVNQITQAITEAVQKEVDRARLLIT